MKSSYTNYPPPNLIDGKLDNFANTKGDEENGMWVRVYLEETFVVTKIIVYNRQECCKDRLIGGFVFIKSGDEKVSECGEFKDTKDFYAFDCKGEGNVIELSQEGKVGEWNIAEIVIYGGEFANYNLIVQSRYIYIYLDHEAKSKNEIFLVFFPSHITSLRCRQFERYNEKLKEEVYIAENKIRFKMPR